MNLKRYKTPTMRVVTMRTCEIMATSEKLPTDGRDNVVIGAHESEEGFEEYEY